MLRPCQIKIIRYDGAGWDGTISRHRADSAKPYQARTLCPALKTPLCSPGAAEDHQ